MATGTLTSTTIASTYKSLLKVKGGANQVLESGSTAHYLEDGDGNDSVLSLSQAFVGIGNEAPLALLSVGAITTLVTDGTTAVTPEGMNVHITEASKYAMGIKNADASGDGLLIQAGDAADDFALRVEDYDSANDLFVVQGGGSVGIGTASPNLLPTSGANTLTILSSNSGSNVYGGVLELQNSDADAANDEFGKIEFQNLNAGSGVTGRAIILASTPDGVHNTSQIKFYSMKAGTAQHAVTINSEGGINETGGVLKENLLTNSGFDVWSHSTLVEATSGAAPVLDGANSALTNNLITNGGFDSATTGWSSAVGAGSAATLASVGSGKTGNCLRVTAASGTATGASTSFTCVIGKLYQVTYHYNRGDIAALSSAIGTAAYPSLGYGSIHGYGEVPGETETDTDFSEAVTYVFEATATTHYLTIFGTMGATQVMYIDSVTAYEVTPGITNPTGNCLCFDGWSAGTSHAGLDFFRQENIDVGHASNKTNSKLGSFYALKIQFTRDSSVFSGAVWPGPLQHTTAGSGSVDPVHLEKFRGKTVTLGCWVKSSTTGKGGIAIDDADTVTTVVTTGTSWEWLEVTDTIGDTSASFDIHLLSSPIADGSYITYFSQPMLVFGSSIGEGNYTRPQGEIVYFEKKVASNYLNGNTGMSDEDATLNTEADSNGAVPKGAKGLFVLTNCGDSGSAGSSATDTWFTMRADGNADWIYYNVPQGKADDKRHIKTAWQPCNADGDVTYGVYASGSGTFDVVQFEYKGVQLR